MLIIDDVRLLFAERKFPIENLEQSIQVFTSGEGKPVSNYRLMAGEKQLDISRI